MSKFRSFIDLKRYQGKDISFLIQDSPVEVIVGRRSSTGTRPGFGSEVGDYADVGRIVARIDAKKKRLGEAVKTAAGEAIPETYIGLTDDTKITPRTGDIWKVGDKEYEVTGIESRYRNCYVVLLTKNYGT